jgi:hypothetical protein
MKKILFTLILFFYANSAFASSVIASNYPTDLTTLTSGKGVSSYYLGSGWYSEGFGILSGDVSYGDITSITVRLLATTTDQIKIALCRSDQLCRYNDGMVFSNTITPNPSSNLQDITFTFSTYSWSSGDLRVILLSNSSTGSRLAVDTSAEDLSFASLIYDGNFSIFTTHHAFFTVNGVTPPQIPSFSITSPIDGSIATSSLSYIGVAWSNIYASSTYAVSVSGLSYCSPAEIDIGLAIHSGSHYFTCPIGVTPTTISALLYFYDTNGLLQRIEKKIIVYSPLYEATYGHSATSTVGSFVSQGCNASTCAISDITGCTKIAMCWAFVPLSDSMPDWMGLYSTIGKKPPYGYISVLTSGLAGLDSTSTSSLIIMSSTTVSRFSGVFSPIRAGMATLLWLVGCVWLLNRVKNIQV